MFETKDFVAGLKNNTRSQQGVSRVSQRAPMSCMYLLSGLVALVRAANPRLTFNSRAEFTEQLLLLLLFCTPCWV